MSQLPPLLDSLQQTIAHRAREGMIIRHIEDPLPSDRPDFFSNDYLSLSADQTLRDIFLRRVQQVPPTRLFGSTGSRLTTGDSPEMNALESALKHFFGAPSALLFNSGFSANMAFFATIPRKNDVIIYDELMHQSCREGIHMSFGASYRFIHNSVVSFRECLLGVLRDHPQIIQGASTVFVVVESLYSMDGDFSPLTDIVELVETLVPAGHAHIVVDEAHTSGACGPNGTGYVSHLGLNDRVHTQVHTFGKAWGFHGAVVLSSPIIKRYLVNFGKSVKFSTSMPYTDIYALDACLSVISSACGQELRRRLNHLCRYAREKLFLALKNVPGTLLSLDKADATVAVSDHGLCSPIIPVFSPHATRLSNYLQGKGYPVMPMTYPVVERDKPRIRVIIHAGNTEDEIDSFADELLAWGERELVFLSTGISSGSVKLPESHAVARARL